MNDNIQVFCRLRPLNTLEVSNGGYNCVQVFNGENISFSFREKELKKTIKNTFRFSRVFDPSVTQEDVYQTIGPQTIKDFMEGYNATIFAYGQTGSGKTFTTMGDNVTKSAGLIPRISTELFEHIKQMPATSSAEVQVSFVEIYNEKINDLLSEYGKNLRIRGTIESGFYLEGQKRIVVANEKEILSIVDNYSKRRSTASTDLNERSSRSHAILSIDLRVTDTTGIGNNSDLPVVPPTPSGTSAGTSGGDAMRQFNTPNNLSHTGKPCGSEIHSILHIVDLAGSENITRIGDEKLRQTETIYINQSLSALGKVIQVLSDRVAAGNGTSSVEPLTVVPYRDSKLTKLLQNSLGGNAKTRLIVCCSVSHTNISETVSTLRFGAKACLVRNGARINREFTKKELRRLYSKALAEIRLLKEALKGANAREAGDGRGRLKRGLRGMVSTNEGECADSPGKREELMDLRAQMEAVSRLNKHELEKQTELADHLRHQVEGYEALLAQKREGDNGKTADSQGGKVLLKPENLLFETLNKEVSQLRVDLKYQKMLNSNLKTELDKVAGENKGRGNVGADNEDSGNGRRSARSRSTSNGTKGGNRNINEQPELNGVQNEGRNKTSLTITCPGFPGSHVGSEHRDEKKSVDSVHYLDSTYGYNDFEYDDEDGGFVFKELDLKTCQLKKTTGSIITFLSSLCDDVASIAVMLDPSHKSSSTPVNTASQATKSQPLEKSTKDNVDKHMTCSDGLETTGRDIMPISNTISPSYSPTSFDKPGKFMEQVKDIKLMLRRYREEQFGQNGKDGLSGGSVMIGDGDKTKETKPMSLKKILNKLEQLVRSIFEEDLSLRSNILTAKLLDSMIEKAGENGIDKMLLGRNIELENKLRSDELKHKFVENDKNAIMSEMNNKYIQLEEENRINVENNLKTEKELNDLLVLNNYHETELQKLIKDNLQLKIRENDMTAQILEQKKNIDFLGSEVESIRENCEDVKRSLEDKETKYKNLKTEHLALKRFLAALMDEKNIKNASDFGTGNNEDIKLTQEDLQKIIERTRDESDGEIIKAKYNRCKKLYFEEKKKLNDMRSRGKRYVISIEGLTAKNSNLVNENSMLKDDIKRLMEANDMLVQQCGAVYVPNSGLSGNAASATSQQQNSVSFSVDDRMPNTPSQSIHTLTGRQLNMQTQAQREMALIDSKIRALSDITKTGTPLSSMASRTLSGDKDSVSESSAMSEINNINIERLVTERNKIRLLTSRLVNQLRTYQPLIDNFSSIDMDPQSSAVSLLDESATFSISEINTYDNSGNVNKVPHVSFSVSSTPRGSSLRKSRTKRLPTGSDISTPSSESSGRFVSFSAITPGGTLAEEKPKTPVVDDTCQSATPSTKNKEVEENTPVSPQRGPQLIVPLYQMGTRLIVLVSASKRLHRRVVKLLNGPKGEKGGVLRSLYVISSPAQLESFMNDNAIALMTYPLSDLIIFIDCGLQSGHQGFYCAVHDVLTSVNAGQVHPSPQYIYVNTVEEIECHIFDEAEIIMKLLTSNNI